MNHNAPASVKRALVIKLGHIGDVLVTTPVIRALHEAWPGVRVTMVVNQGTEAMVAHSPQIEQVLVVRRDLGGIAALRSQLALLGALRSARFDLSLELSGGDRGAFLCRASGAGLRVGFEPKKTPFPGQGVSSAGGSAGHPKPRGGHVSAPTQGTGFGTH